MNRGVVGKGGREWRLHTQSKLSTLSRQSLEFFLMSMESHWRLLGSPCLLMGWWKKSCLPDVVTRRDRPTVSLSLFPSFLPLYLPSFLPVNRWISCVHSPLSLKIQSQIYLLTLLSTWQSESEKLMAFVLVLVQKGVFHLKPFFNLSTLRFACVLLNAWHMVCARQMTMTMKLCHGLAILAAGPIFSVKLKMRLYGTFINSRQFILMKTFPSLFIKRFSFRKY